MAFRNCIFDLYGTLIDINTDEEDPELWKMMTTEYEKNGASYTPIELRESYRTLVRVEERRQAQLHPGGCPEIQLESVFYKLFAFQGIVPDRELLNTIGRKFREASTKHLRLYPGVMDMLQALRDRGIGIWLLSNAQHLFTSWELDTLGLTRVFDGVYLSSDYGCKKPDPHFFRTLLEERKIPPQSAVMIGNDAACDIAGAKKVGLATVYIRSNISPVEPLPEADLVLPEMDIAKVKEFLLQE